VAELWAACKTWFMRRRESLQPDANAPKTAVPIPDFGTEKFTITLWVKTSSDDPILAKTAHGGGGGLNKLLFIRAGQVHYDISNIGCVRGRARIAYGSGKFGEALHLSGKGHMVVDCDKGRDLNAGLWGELAAQFTDKIAAQEMSWEREDHIWSHDWKSVTVAEAARRYAVAAQRPASIADRIKAVAAHTRSPRDLKAVRELYLKSRRYGQLSATLSEYKLPELRRRINLLYQGNAIGLRQLTFPQEDEEKLVERYRARPHYHHGTDDMHPCYLPNGDICFISTRCQYGILCDGPDDFSTTVLYRMDGNGKNMRRLTNSSVSEAAPVMLSDGRIMYTRWEYFDKGAVSVKCLWSVYPDGTNSMEVYGNDIALPPTLIYARPIPDMPNGYVTLGTPHYPQNGVGTVIRLDMNKNIRTRDPMTYMTPYVDIRGEGGFHFKTGEDTWESDRSGRRAPLFRDPYPLSPQFFLVSHKPIGPPWNDPKAYGLYLLDENGGVSLIHKEDDISCWQPFPLKPRKRPQIVDSPVDQKMAAQNLAACVVTDIYHGMQDTPRGTIKYIRVLEQIPRPWATRSRFWTSTASSVMAATSQRRVLT